MTYAKKSFGQNFLKDGRALEKIVGAIPLGKKDIVLEIGPGRGALTKELLKTGAHIVAIEIDPDMIEVLEEKFATQISQNQLVIHQGDVLETPLETFGFKDKTFKVVANIPYYITGAILRNFLESNTQPTDMVLLVQKEVAERIVDGVQSKSKKFKKKTRIAKENILSLSIKVYGDVRYVTTVSASSFSPAPRVDSAVIAITNISKQKFANADVLEKDFFTVIKQGFAQRRKTLVNNLKNADRDQEIIFAALGHAKVDEKARAEILTLNQWLILAKYLE